MKRGDAGRLTLKNREAVGGYLFLAPWLIGFFVFALFPLLYSLWLSLCNVSITTSGVRTSFAGGIWYSQAFTVDTTYTTSLLSTLKFVGFSTPMIVVASLIMALLLNGKYFGRTFFRAVFFFPVIIISGHVMSKLVGNQAAAVITPDNFVVYRFVETLPSLISAPVLYIFDNIVLILWFSGVQVLIYLAGLQKVGAPIYEAASIDGASAWQKFWKITLPFLRPLILVNTIYTIVDLSSFAGNAVNQEITSKMTLTGKVYSYSAALSWVYFVTIALLLVVAFLLLRERGAGKGAAR